MRTRRRFKQAKPFRERLSDFVNDLRKKIEDTPEGTERERMVTKLERAKSAAKIDSWANSPGLQPPKK